MNSVLSSAVTRREFLGAIGAAGVTLGLGVAPLAQAAASKKIPVGLQLYSLREQCQKDLPGMLAAVSKIGYRGVEFAGYHGRSAKELRKLLDDNGLVACGTHTPYDSVQGDKLKETVEFNRTIGNKFLIVPWMNEAKSKQEWLDRAKLFNEIADKVKPDGMWVGYHAHQHDFKQIDGVYRLGPVLRQHQGGSNHAARHQQLLRRRRRPSGGAEEVSRPRAEHPYQSFWRRTRRRHWRGQG